MVEVAENENNNDINATPTNVKQRKPRERILKHLDPAMSFKEYQKHYNKDYYSKHPEKFYTKSDGTKPIGRPKKIKDPESGDRIKAKPKCRTCPHCNKVYNSSITRHLKTRSCQLSQCQNRLKETKDIEC